MSIELEPPLPPFQATSVFLSPAESFSSLSFECREGLDLPVKGQTARKKQRRSGDERPKEGGKKREKIATVASGPTRATTAMKMKKRECKGRAFAIRAPSKCAMSKP